MNFSEHRFSLFRIVLRAGFFTPLAQTQAEMRRL